MSYYNIIIVICSLILFMIACTFEISGVDGEALVLKHDDQSMFISSPNPPCDIVILNNRLYLYSLSNSLQCTDSAETVFFKNENAIFRKCQISQREMKIAFSTGVKMYFSIPRNITTPYQLMRHLQAENIIGTSVELPDFEKDPIR